MSATSPVAFGYGTDVPVISANGMVFNVSNTLGRAGGRLLMDPYAERPTGRGSLEDSDEPAGRKAGRGRAAGKTAAMAGKESSMKTRCATTSA